MTYQSKSADSFETRKRFYIFHKVILGQATIDQQEFMKFDMDSDDKTDLVKRFLTEYYHLDRKANFSDHTCLLTMDEIYERMVNYASVHYEVFNILKARYLTEIFPGKLSIAKFKELEQAQECEYCGITLKEIIELSSKQKIFKKNERGWVMEIDRRKPNKEYSDENCVAACYWCNNAKTDEFDDVEFKPIGEAIGVILRARLTS
jgi:5-methylcytosine-specific restriction endonuclease McrA